MIGRTDRNFWKDRRTEKFRAGGRTIQKQKERNILGAGRPAEGLAGCIDAVLAALSALPELTHLQLDPRLKRDDEAYNALQDACNRFDIDLHSFGSAV